MRRGIPTCGAACRAWRYRFRKISNVILTLATFTSSGVAAANDRHSAYSFRHARVAYRWHPLFDRTLRVSRNRRGKDLTCIYTDERPDLARELPNWMFDESYCASMSLGPPQVSVEALNELRMSRALLKFEERALLFKSYAASAI